MNSQQILESFPSSLTKIYASDLSDSDREIMFNMYVTSYTMGGQELWFTTKDELFKRYPCVVTFSDMYLIVYAMYQIKTHCNKISLVCHNGSDEGKKLSIQLRLQLIHLPGWILEAADKVSWLLRKQNAPIISNYQSILTALDITNNPNDTIELNKAFNYDDKSSYQYVRTFFDAKNNKTYHSRETLFGTNLCVFSNDIDGNVCTRNCDKLLNTDEKVGGNTRKRKKQRIQKRKITYRKRHRKYRHFKTNRRSIYKKHYH